MSCRLVLALACSLAVGCGPRALRPEAIHPTPEQISALARLPIPGKPADLETEAPFSIRLSSRVVLAGRGVWISCHVPQSYGRGRVRLGLEGVRMFDEQLDINPRPLLIEAVPCGTWEAVCMVRTRRGLESRSERLEARGECNDGDGGDR